MYMLVNACGKASGNRFADEFINTLKMEESGSGTYLEDFIMSLETLPSDFRREIELVNSKL